MGPNDQNPLGGPQKPLEPSQESSPTPSSPVTPPLIPSPESSAQSSSVPPKKEGNDDFSTKNKEREQKNSEKNTLHDSTRDYAFIEYTKHNKEAVCTYALLLIGILFLVFNGFLLGSLLIGLVAGYHFSHEIIFYLRNLTQIFAGQEKVRYIVLTAVIVSVFIAIPGIFIGALVAAVLREVIAGNREM